MIERAQRGTKRVMVVMELEKYTLSIMGTVRLEHLAH